VPGGERRSPAQRNRIGSRGRGIVVVSAPETRPRIAVGAPGWGGTPIASAGATRQRRIPNGSVARQVANPLLGRSTRRTIANRGTSRQSIVTVGCGPPCRTSTTVGRQKGGTRAAQRGDSLALIRCAWMPSVARFDVAGWSGPAGPAAKTRRMFSVMRTIRGSGRGGVSWGQPV
jgi:hypothetical protein